MSALRIAIIILAGDAPIEALGARPYPVSAPQGAAFPYLLVSLVGENDEQMLSGAGRFPEARIEVQCVATSAAAADDLGEAVKRCLEDVTKLTVTSGESPAGFSAVATILKEGSDFTDQSDDRSVFRRTLDFRVRWR